MLEKPEYDCNNLDDYDCGCGEEHEEEAATTEELKVVKKDHADADSNPAVEITKEP